MPSAEMASVPPRAAGPVLVTRPAGRGEHLASLLEAEGLTAEHAPLTRLVPSSNEELEAALAQLAAGAFTHLVVTSRTAAERLAGAEAPFETAIIAVGGGTAETLRAAGLSPTAVADGSGAALVAAMPPAAPGDRVLLPASSAASRTVPEGLRAAGYEVVEVEAYRPEPVDPPPAVAEGLVAGRYAAIVLTSPMIARRAAELGVHPATAVIAIGDPTAEAVRAAGLGPLHQAAAPTDEALVAAVLEALDAAPHETPPSGPAAAGPAPSAAHPTHPRSKETR
ncbi:uroporphyrinogen-III synthase [Brachybacterium paraconglomeratum]|uniref:uroporphyrinogen-III synthase n=1 Tax=Brachybacterium paraconglomeratum TaxID=173362 RepID=UPI0037CB6748